MSRGILSLIRLKLEKDIPLTQDEYRIANWLGAEVKPELIPLQPKLKEDDNEHTNHNN